MKRLGALVLVLAAGPCAAQQFYAPDTISEAAQAELREKKSPALRPPYPAASDLPAWKRIFEEREASLASENAEVVRAFEPSVKPTVLGGVSVLDIRPKGWKDNRKVAVYLHGGGYTFLSPASTLTASVPVAQETGLRVISVDYTRAPFAKFRQITGEAIEVLKALQGEGSASRASPSTATRRGEAWPPVSSCGCATKAWACPAPSSCGRPGPTSRTAATLIAR